MSDELNADELAYVHDLPHATPADAMRELLPCPFCGGPAELLSTTDQHSVECWDGECGARGPFAETAPFAIEQWNRRPPTLSAETVEKIRDHLEHLASMARHEGDEGLHRSTSNLLAILTTKPTDDGEIK